MKLDLPDVNITQTVYGFHPSTGGSLVATYIPPHLANLKALPLLH